MGDLYITGMKFFTLLFALALQSGTFTHSQTIIDLYGKNGLNDNNPVPNSKPCNKSESYVARPGDIGRVSNIMRPTIQVFSPSIRDKANSSIIIFPGGGYSILAIDHEGYDVAKAFNELGVTAFVVKNRLPDSACMNNPDIVPLMDAQQAIKIVRSRAPEWQLDANKIGILGFSAGGHLASTLGTHFNEKVTENAANISLRPDYMVLMYPVISFDDSITHKGSKNNLIGKNPSPEQVSKFSNELQVNASTPPTFLVHAANDKAVPVQNSLRFFEALNKNNVPAELHVYQGGGHGFGLNNPTTHDQWMGRLQSWLIANQFLQGK